MQHKYIIGYDEGHLDDAALVLGIRDNLGVTHVGYLLYGLIAKEVYRALISEQYKDARIAELEEALRFYENKERYKGANQKPIDGDKFQPPDLPYRLDVTRDGGNIARQALKGK